MCKPRALAASVRGMLPSRSASRSGLFTWIAIRLTKVSGSDPLVLLVCHGTMTVVFSTVLDNVTAMIITGSLSAVSLDRLGRSDKLLGFLQVEGLPTNVGGISALVVGDLRR